MAENRITALGAEVLHSGKPTTAATVSFVGGEVLHSGDPATPVRMSFAGVEVLRSVARNIPEGAARYWRVRQFISNDNLCGGSALTFLNENENPIDALEAAATPIGSSIYSGQVEYSYTHMFDNNNNTIWASNTSGRLGDEWVGLDFGAGNEYLITGFIYRSREGFGAQSPAAGWLERSDDGVVWTKVFPFFAGMFGSGESKTFTAPDALPAGDKAHRYWRLHVETVDDSYCAGSAVALYADSDRLIEFHPPDIAAWSQSSVYGGLDALNAVDGNDNTSFIFNGGAGSYLTFDFGEGNAYTINAIGWRSRHDGYQWQGARSGYLSFSDDGVIWSDPVWEYFFAPWTSPGQWQYTSAPLARPGGQRQIIIT